MGIGGTFQIGFDIALGKQTTSVDGKWNHYSSAMGSYVYSGSPQMRFTNDPGGQVDYSGNYGSTDVATITGGNKELQTPAFSRSGLNIDATAAQTSSYVNYGKDEFGLIKFIDVTNKDGSRSDYDLPVYVRNEAELSIGVPNQDGSYLVYNSLNYTHPMDNPTVVGQKSVDTRNFIGSDYTLSKPGNQYASVYLLKYNKTFDYVDADGNGIPSQDDFGGWTKFDYRKTWGGDATHLNDNGNSEWYRYRAPYNGLTYNNGRISDQYDQTGSMSSGEKEIYYLKTVETKTHIAFFVTNKTTVADFPEVSNGTGASYGFLYDNSNHLKLDPNNITGSNIPRKDGFDAAAIRADGTDGAADNSVARGTHDLEKLERIVLYAKNDLSKPLSTTYFEYDYSLCKNVPNNNGHAEMVNGVDVNANKGKLTLKKVWMESGGVMKSKIAPYQFDYEYFNNYPTEISSVAVYPWANAYSSLTSQDQNPEYKPEQLDSWGFYQLHGADRFAKMQHWVTQKSPSSGENFDPAAWQLKRIQLPSGGEIHIQYEQKDYSYVQNEKPMAMVSLNALPATLPESMDQSDRNYGYVSDDNCFYINTDDIEVTYLNAYKAMLRDYFVNAHHKLYFKALYSYIDDAVPKLTGDSKSEYITGYTTVNKVEIDNNNKIYLILGDTRDNGNGKKDKTLPRYVCYQNLLGSGGRNLGQGAHNWEGDADDYMSGMYPTDANNHVSTTVSENGLKDIAKQHVFGKTIDLFVDWTGGLVKNVTRKNACKKLNYELSYFKLPVYNAKKGGGIRVKRLLSYDPGIENGDAMIYGSEYIYKLEDGITSSGVATNEPAAGREENALVGFLERKKQTWFNKTLNGRDTKQFEGPLGENVLPAASVVYERVVVRNIHSGKTSTGYTVNKYHTDREFPMEVECSPISKKDNTYKKFYLSMPLGIFNMDINKAWVTQGYLFKENDMNGKPESQATYSGSYDPTTFKETAYTSKTTYNYSAPGSKIKTLVYNGTEMEEKMLNPGTEEDVTMFMSNVKDKTTNASVELDLDISILALSLGFGLSYSFSNNEMSQHVTSKVISQKTYLLSTTTTVDGVTQTTENLAFDKYTGDPVFTRTYDGYMAPNEKIYTENDANRHNGYYYALNIPASWMYSDMSSKSLNANNSNQLTVSAGNVVTYGGSELYDAMTHLPEPLPWNPSTTKLNNVVNASATVYKNNWFFNSTDADYSSLPAATQNTLNQHFYPYRSYVYRAEVKNANDDKPANNAMLNKIYGGGVVSTPFDFFNSWAVPAPSGNNPPTDILSAEIGKWYSPTEITAYSFNGNPVEEKDVLGVRSTAKFGYNNTLPVLVAQNAQYNEVQFTDFEYGMDPSDQSNISTDAHSGNASYNLSNNKNKVFATDYDITSLQSAGRGARIQLWLKSSLSQTKGSPDYGMKNINPQLKALIGGQQYNFNRVAQTGDWSLYTADIKNFNGLTAGRYDVTLSYNYAANEQVLVDDFRIQPLDAVMNCTVFLSNNKVAAQFDDQHFGTYYEYNAKGQLVRKSIETERGKKTLQEQQYNTPLNTPRSSN